ncbi:Ig-like domain-containing protein [Verrucosispora sp. ts21]|uniref:Ig-like domain-containing protein n=1 Tax=Verrucosispora sp. ts21 TaxID=2069341 RepID=UPI00336582CA
MCRIGQRRQPCETTPRRRCQEPVGVEARSTTATTESGYVIGPAPSSVAGEVKPGSVRATKQKINIYVDFTSEGTARPRGAVEVFVDGMSVGTTTINPAGKSKVQAGPFPTAGGRTVTASYSGDDHSAQHLRSGAPPTSRKDMGVESAGPLRRLHRSQASRFADQRQPM